MSRGLLLKSAHEVWGVTLLCGAGVFIFEIIMAAVMRAFPMDKIEFWFEIEFIQKFAKAMLGSEFGDRIDPNQFLIITWVHPVVLALIWAHEITLCTRMPAGEVDRGTIDTLFALPVSRWRLYVCETLMVAVSGAFVVGLVLVGYLVGNIPTAPETRPSFAHSMVITGNLYCLYTGVGGLAFFISSLSDRRGRAVATTFGIVVGSFFLSFVEQFWEPARHLSFLNILNYYRPLLVMRDGSWPVTDMLTLGCFGLILWVAGGLILNRRDICTT